MTPFLNVSWRESCNICSASFICVFVLYCDDFYIQHPTPFAFHTLGCAIDCTLYTKIRIIQINVYFILCAQPATKSHVTVE